MKKLFNKYFNYIGVKNEGYKRIVFLIILTMWISEFYTNFFFSEMVADVLVEIKKFIGIEHTVHFVTDEIDLIIGISILIFFPFILFGLLIGTFNWVKEGFNK